jgi:aminopeptidase N
LVSGRQWITEGLAHFAQALVRERQDGRKAALAYMQAFRPALAAAEKQALTPSSSESRSARGESLAQTSDEIYYRAKAMFVWWMLRDMLGDPVIQRAIRAYRATEDKEPSYVQRLLETQSKRQLEWFFDDWVYRDRGLPDLRVETAYPRKLLEDRYTVTVTVENLGDAAAEVPVIVPLKAGDATERVMVPANGKAVVRVQAPEAPAEVTVNDGSVPESDMSNNTFKVKPEQR